MERYALLLAFILATAGVHAQSLADSLRNALSRQQGAMRYQTLRQLCNIYVRPTLNNQEVFEYAEELIAMASAQKDTAALVLGYVSMALKEKQTLDNALGEYLPKAKELAKNRPQLMAEALYWENQRYASLGMDDEALNTIAKALALLDRHRLNSSDYRIRLLGSAASIYSTRNEIPATDSLLKAMVSYPQTPADSMEMYRFVAVCYENRGILDKALDAYLKSYRSAKRINNALFAVTCLRKAATILRDQRQFDKALEYYKEAATLAETNKHFTQIGSIYHSIGMLYRQSGNYEEAIRYGQLALGIKEDAGRPQKIVVTASMIAESYHAMKRYGQLKEVCLKYLPISQSVKMYETTSIMGYLAVIAHAKTGQPGQGMRWLGVANDAAAQLKNMEELPPALQFAAEAHAVLGLYQEAYAYQVKYQAAKDSLFDIEKNRIVQETEAAFETEKQAERIRDLHQKNAINKAQLTAAHTRQWALAIGLLSLGVIAFAFYRNAVLRNRNNLALQQVNADLQRKNSEIQTLLREVHHRVKNNLQLVSSLLRLQARNIPDHETAQLVQASQERIHAMSLIHEQLYQHQVKQQVALRPYLTQLTDSLLHSQTPAHCRISLELEAEELELEIDKIISLGLIVNELLTNAFKHAFIGHSEGQVWVSMKQEGGLYRLSIKDNGRGMALKNGKPHTPRHSFGLELVQDLADKLNGHISFANGIGTTTTLTFNP